jgi:hypothetical protein
VGDISGFSLKLLINNLLYYFRLDPLCSGYPDLDGFYQREKYFTAGGPV